MPICYWSHYVKFDGFKIHIYIMLIHSVIFTQHSYDHVSVYSS